MNEENLHFINIYKDIINVFNYKPTRRHPNIALGHITLIVSLTYSRSFMT